MAETWYEVWKGTGAIRPLQVERRTDKTLYVEGSGRRASIETSYAKHFPELAEAVQYAKAIGHRRYDSALRAMTEAQKFLAGLEAAYPKEYRGD